jgi:putative ABC transport system substrate-binding protein
MDVIVSAGAGATRILKEATATIPIVMAQDDDPVGSGFVASLARPGGNITGLSTLAPELSGKRLELLKETVPALSRVAVFGSSVAPANALAVSETKRAAVALGVQVQYLDLQGPKDIETVFRAAVEARADGVLMLIPGPILRSHGAQIRNLALKNRLPAIYERRNDVEAGGLWSYGPVIEDLYRRAATTWTRS